MSLDQFFTPPEVAKHCWEVFQRELRPPEDAVFVEPSVGRGAFHRLLPAGQRIGYEIDPALCKDQWVLQQDFLQLDKIELTGGPPLYFIGNPPFGRQGMQARAFYKQAFALGAKAVGFIMQSAAVPRKDYKVIYQERIPGAFDLPDGGTRAVNGCWFYIMVPGAPERRAMPSSSYAEVYSISTGYGNDNGRRRIDECELFTRACIFGGQSLDRLGWYDSVPPKFVGYGIKLLKEPQAVRAYLTGNAIPTSLKGGHYGGRRCTSKRLLLEHLLAGGFS